MDAVDWRTTLRPDSRQRIVNKIMETLKRCLPISSGPEGLVQLSEMATRFEEKIYTAATSQSDYLRKISMKMLTMETRHNVVDWQEEIYQKIKTMKELYLSDLNDIYQEISIKCQQHRSVLNAPEQIERLKMFKNMVELNLQFLNVSRNNIVLGVMEKLPAYEKQIIGILNSNRPRKPVSAQQQIQQYCAMPLLSNRHMELLSPQTIQSISSNTNIFKIQHLEHQKQQLEQQFQEWQMYQQGLNQRMQHVLQQHAGAANTSGATAAVICSIADNKPNVTASSYTAP